MSSILDINLKALIHRNCMKTKAHGWIRLSNSKLWVTVVNFVDFFAFNTAKPNHSITVTKKKKTTKRSVFWSFLNQSHLLANLCGVKKGFGSTQYNNTCDATCTFAIYFVHLEEAALFAVRQQARKPLLWQSQFALQAPYGEYFCFSLCPSIPPTVLIVLVWFCCVSVLQIA
jgi:hypothetical protein